MKNAKKMKKKEREGERKRNSLVFSLSYVRSSIIFQSSSTLLLLLLFSLVVNHAYSARVFGQPKRKLRRTR